MTPGHSTFLKRLVVLVLDGPKTVSYDNLRKLAMNPNCGVHDRYLVVEWASDGESYP